MLNRLIKPKEHNEKNNTSAYQPSLMDSSHSRIIARQRIRGSDSLFRVGGDEFALVLLDANAHSALKVANEIRMLVKQEAPESLPDYAVSFGVCCVDDSASAEDWLEQADAAMYSAKESGGDRAKMAE